MDLTIVTYHYVRDLQRSRYPGIKARTVQQFEEQLDFISKNYAVVTAQDVVLAVLGAQATTARRLVADLR